MSTNRVIAAAAARGIYFDGIREWQNSATGYGYLIKTPLFKTGHIVSYSLDNLYENIKSFPMIPRSHRGTYYFDQHPWDVAEWLNKM